MPHPQSLMVGSPDYLGLARSRLWVIPRAAQQGACRVFGEGAESRFARPDYVDEDTCFSNHRSQVHRHILTRLLTNRWNTQDACHHTERHEIFEPRHLKHWIQLTGGKSRPWISVSDMIHMRLE